MFVIVIEGHFLLNEEQKKQTIVFNGHSVKVINMNERNQSDFIHVIYISYYQKFKKG